MTDFRKRVLLAAMVGVMGPVCGAQTVAARVSVASLPSMPMPHVAEVSHSFSAGPGAAMNASLVNRAYSFSATGQAWAPAAGTETGATISSLDTRVLYVNYADAAREDFQLMTAPATDAAGNENGLFGYTLRMPGVQAALSMGGGDVAMTQPGMFALAKAAAIAEAGVDISTHDHRFGVRVQGRAIVNQTMVYSLPAIHEAALMLTEKPSFSAYFHF